MSELYQSRTTSRHGGLATGLERTDWVDMAKGLCIVLVVMMHSAGGVAEMMGSEGFVNQVVTFAKPFRIPAFFLLAGLFLHRTIDTPWAKYSDKKVVHFIYFYALWAAIQIALKFGAIQGVIPAFRAFAAAWVEPFGTLWFIYMLPVFFVVTKLTRHIPPALVLIGASLLEMAHIHSGWTAIDEFSARFVWFFAGYCLSLYVFDWASMVRDQKTSAACFVIGFALINGLLVLRGQADSAGISLFLGALGSASLIATVILLERTPFGRLLATAGRQSIIIYLAFFLPMILMRLLLLRTGIAGLIGVSATSLLVWLTAVIVPLLIHRPIMRSPLRFLFERPHWAHWPDLMAKPRARQNKVLAGH